MTTLVEQIRAALDEDERIASRAAKAHEGAPSWCFNPGNEDVEPAAFLGKRSLYSDYHGNEGLMPSEVEHIARFDPARVLREVAAKRKILAKHAEVLARHPAPPGEANDLAIELAALYYAIKQIAEGYGIEEKA